MLQVSGQLFSEMLFSKINRDSTKFQSNLKSDFYTNAATKLGVMEKINRIMEFEKSMAVGKGGKQKSEQNIHIMNQLLKESENFKVVVCS